MTNPMPNRVAPGEVFDHALYDDFAAPAPGSAAGAVVPYSPPAVPVRIPVNAVVTHDADGRPLYTVPAGPSREAQSDPWPRRLLCGGVGIGAAGLGLSFLLHAIEAAAVGLGALAAVVFAIAWLLRSGGKSASGSGGWSIKGDNNHVRIGR